MVRYYVYTLIDPRDGSVFYIGKGAGNRIHAHEREAKAGRQSRKCERIRDIEAAGLQITKRKVKHFADEQDAYDFEAEMIDGYRLDRLCNIVPGGGTARGTPTIYADRQVVNAVAGFVNRTRNGAIKALLVAGQRMDLVPILEHYRLTVGEIVSRRGFDWVNAVSKRYSVVFSDA